MKLFSVMLMAVCLLFAGTAFAAEADHKTPTKQYVSMRSGTNSEVGRIYADGKVCNKNNQTIGSFKPNGEVRNKNNQKIGLIKSDGEVRNQNNQKMGTVRANGTVYNQNNQKIGIAPGLKKEWVAGFYFFFFN